MYAYKHSLRVFLLFIVWLLNFEFQSDWSPKFRCCGVDRNSLILLTKHDRRPQICCCFRDISIFGFDGHFLLVVVVANGCKLLDFALVEEPARFAVEISTISITVFAHPEILAGSVRLGGHFRLSVVVEIMVGWFSPCFLLLVGKHIYRYRYSN